MQQDIRAFMTSIANNVDNVTTGRQLPEKPAVRFTFYRSEYWPLQSTVPLCRFWRHVAAGQSSEQGNIPNLKKLYQCWISLCGCRQEQTNSSFCLRQ